MALSSIKRMWHPTPAPPAFGAGKVMPDTQASFLSLLTFSWINPLLFVGWSRPLERDDLWDLDEERSARAVADQLEATFYSRCPPFKLPRHIRIESLHAARSVTAVDDNTQASANFVNVKLNRKMHDMSLLRSLYTVFFHRFWVSGILRLVGDSLNTCTPLVSKLLIDYITASYIAHRASSQSAVKEHVAQPKSISYGVGLAFAIFGMQQLASLCNNMFFYIAMTMGFLVRTSLVSIIFRKSLRLSGKSKEQHSTGQITTLISTDCTRLDVAAGLFHLGWSAPIQIVIGIGLLIKNLGVSALVGLAVLLLSLPLQAVVVKNMVSTRRATLAATDKRVRLLHDILQGIRLLLLFNWQGHYYERITELRRTELGNVRKFASYRGVLTAVTTFVPVLAATLTFITYALLGNSLDPGIIFSSLQLFNIIRAPLFYFPLIAAACCLLGRLYEIEDVNRSTQHGQGVHIFGDEHHRGDLSDIPAVKMQGSFTWERGGVSSGPTGPAKLKTSEKEMNEILESNRAEEKAKAKAKDQAWKEQMEKWSRGDPTEINSNRQEENDVTPFALRDIDLQIRKGSFVAIVGCVASGKSSILQAMTGDMRRLSGDVSFDGNVAYAPQTPWIMNLSLRDNILFGQDWDTARFQQVIHACALERDIENLRDGVETEIGERGVNLSGGQKARINLARVAYSNADIALLDDPLSAVDSLVSAHILANCLLAGPLAERTRVLITHQLNILPYVDEVIVVEAGKITERGTYRDILDAGGALSKLLQEYGSEVVPVKQKGEDFNQRYGAGNNASSKELPTKLVQGDERETGAVSSVVYARYASAAGGVSRVALLLVWLAIAQLAQIANTLFLGFWSQNSISGFTSGRYMGIYSGVGFGTALFTFIAAVSFAQAGFSSSLSLFSDALKAVMWAPLAWHEKTPAGAIMNRLSKDVDTLDSALPQAWFQLLNNVSTIVGTVGLVFYAYAWLGIAFPPLIVLYCIMLSYYRRTSIEAKRLDSVLRTTLYAGFTEALSGLSTIRAYHAENRFVSECERRLDSENRAYFITIVAQRWLTVRIDLLNNLLILGIGLVSVGLRNSTDPAKLGIVLTYALSVTQIMGQTISLLAQVEQNMNTVERVIVYTELEQEPPHQQLADPTDGKWPTAGAIEFDRVCLRYRSHLPLSLKSVSFSVKPGERIGIVGRTGAGKSSILSVLFRTNVQESGAIRIDGVDIGTLGLATLRNALSIIPQDTFLFEGSLRSNIDPAGQRTDYELYDALRQAGLVNDADPKDRGQAKFDLEREVRDDSFSAGEKQLLALCRALVRTESKILVLDEATSSVDVATDSKVQMMIQEHFRDITLLCIAHRLSTIVYYDRVLVMEHGEAIEFDTPINLFEAGGSFRSLCDRASLSREDILRIRAAAYNKED